MSGTEIAQGTAITKAEPLELPRGVRFPREDEFRWGQNAERERVAQARLVTGYRCRQTPDDSFSAFFEANVHASRIWECFSDLVIGLLPEVAAPLIEFKGAEPIYGPYVARASALEVFRPHATVLAHEGYLGFGLMFQHLGRTEEVLVHPAKYLQIWTNQSDRVREILARHGLMENPELCFLDEYPMVTEALCGADGNSLYPVLMQSVEIAFSKLIPVDPP